jgi:hypothetical protein
VGSLTHLLEQHAGRLVATRFDASVHWRLWLPAGREPRFAAALDLLTHGRHALTPPLDLGA